MVTKRCRGAGHGDCGYELGRSDASDPAPAGSISPSGLVLTRSHLAAYADVPVALASSLNDLNDFGPRAWTGTALAHGAGEEAEGYTSFQRVDVAGGDKEVHMACEDIEARLKDLRGQKRSLELLMPGMRGPALLAMWDQLARLEGQIAVEEKNLDDCGKLNQTTPPVPFIGRVKDIHCKEPKKEVGPNEPFSRPNCARTWQG